jgi:hypothetical protein
MVNNHPANDFGLHLKEKQDQSTGDLQPKTRIEKKEWVSPELREFGSLSFVVKGISYRPLDGISNLT